MSLLSEVLGAIGEIEGDAEVNALRFRCSGTWSDGTVCRYSVGDPTKGQDKPLRLQTDPMPGSLRLLKLWPGDPEPAVGASIAHQLGALVLGLWSDESAYTGQRVGVCRLVDARAYPTVAATLSGAGLRLRIVALGGAGLSTGSNDLVTTASDSHRAHLPPGVALQVADVIVTTDGDQYSVVSPVQRDALGDTLGLSWQRGGQPLPTIPGSGSSGGGATPSPSTPDADDSYWRQPVL